MVAVIRRWRDRRTRSRRVGRTDPIYGEALALRAQVPAAAVVAAMTGPVPKPGDIVRITERAAIEFARNPVPNFRVTDVELIDNWPGWCRIRGWDIDRIGDPPGGPIEHTWHRVLISGLVIRPGDGWNK